MCEEVARCPPPTPSLHTWVDGIVQRCEAPRQRLVDTLFKAGQQLVKGLQTVSLATADKSCVISSGPQTASELAQRFAAASVSIQVKSNAPDLGLDRGRIAKRRPKQAARRVAASFKIRRLSRFAKGA
eukprot:5295477-Pyramimonas_sp.AAC.1